MKKYIITTFFSLLFIGLFSSCEEDTTLPPMYPDVYSEDFSRPKDEPPFNFQDWVLFSQAGSKTWFKGSYKPSGETIANDYIEFSSFGSGDASNIGWAITPAYNLDLLAQKALIFQSAQHHVTSVENKLEVLVSTNFNGIDVLGATWIPVKFKAPAPGSVNYVWVNSGRVDLSAFSGNIYIAYKVTGNGLQNSTQSGAYQIDNIKLF